MPSSPEAASDVLALGAAFTELLTTAAAADRVADADRTDAQLEEIMADAMRSVAEKMPAERVNTLRSERRGRLLVLIASGSDVVSVKLSEALGTSSTVEVGAPQ